MVLVVGHFQVSEFVCSINFIVPSNHPGRILDGAGCRTNNNCNTLKAVCAGYDADGDGDVRGDGPLR